ncbi:GNAT family N-acetyltransferase [Thomasclavelia cocleata]|uniref:Putative acetyltransferase n=1 Tax=Thomasclavelia cocleata TaxID=69824 RepID=A0A1I0F020_9FIRM|nr:GNAT family N-acetyltransferase [Thomasclavelia cocleata]MCR1960333.1 GNAT family N-acetyltransferase [Thomasclavelia cocleata]SET51185.1 putative acetyltransferase [Thomasclavelia cocleata]
MKFREYQSSDLKEICELFYETITIINKYDYNDEQIRVWSNRRNVLLKQDNFFYSLYTIVAIENNKIVGYGNIDKNGYLDHLYVHKNYQRRHIATLLCDKLENYNKEIKELTVHSSITAKPFFEKRGYKVVKEQTVELDGVNINNYLMKKVIL